jgi:hypothetical protein
VFPTRYVFPVLDAGSSETIIDAIYFKPNAFSQD